jgi:hypothetical protein
LYVITFKQHRACSGGVACAGTDHVTTASVEAAIRATVTRRILGDALLADIPSIMAFLLSSNADAQNLLRCIEDSP